MLQSDNQTVLVTLDTAQSQFSSAVFTVKNVYASNALNVIPTSNTTLTFSDTTVPTVASVTAIGNKQVKVVFSESVLMPTLFDSNAGVNFQIDGQAATNSGFSTVSSRTVGTDITSTNYANSITLNFAVALSAGQHTLTVPAGVVMTSLSDAANFALAKTTVNFAVNSVTTSPTISGVTGQNNGTVLVTYNRGMDPSLTGAALTLANYSIGGINPATAKYTDSTDTVVQLGFATGAVASGANVLVINKNVADSYGNVLDADNDVRVSFTATSDTTAPTVTSVVMISSPDLRVKFSESVNAVYAKNIANYTLKDSAGTDITSNITTLTALSPDVNGNSDTYDLTISPALTGSQYTLKIVNIQDLAATPNVMADYTATVTGSDTTAPTVTDALQVTGSTSQVVVEYSEVMNANITTAASYAYQGHDGSWYALPASATVVAGNGNKNVTITFPTGYTVDAAGTGAATSFVVEQIRVANVSDVAGNTLSGIAQSIDITPAASAITGPTYTANSFTLSSNSTQVLATIGFNQPVTSLVKADFNVVSIVPDSAYISGNNVVLVFTNTANMATIKAAGVTAQVKTVGTASTNSAGAPIIAIAATSVYNDQIAPALVATPVVAAHTGNTVTITLNGPIDAGIQGLYTDDFTVIQGGAVLSVSSATVAGAVLTLNIDLTTPVTAGAQVTVRANASKIDIQSKADGAGNNVKYVPTTTDTNGYTVVAGL